MLIDFSCECGRPFRVDTANAGRQAKCPTCGRSFVVPLPGGGPAAAAAPSPVAVQYAPVAAPMPGPVVPTPGYAAPPPPRFAHAPATAGYQRPPPGAMPAPDAAYLADADPSLVLAAAAALVGASSRGRRGPRPKLFHRTELFVALGATLLLGFFAPVLVPSAYLGDRLMNPNIEGLSESRVPVAVQMICLAPAVAALAVLACAFKATGVVRGAVVGLFGLLPFLTLLLSDDVRSMLDPTRGGIGGGAAGDSKVLALASAALAAAGWVGMVAGALGLRRRPQYRPLSVVAAAGATAYLVHLVIPTGDGVRSMPLLSFLGDDGVGSEVTRQVLGGSVVVMLALTMCGWIMAAALSLVSGLPNRFTPDRAWVVLWVIVGTAGTGVITAFVAVDRAAHFVGEDNVRTTIAGAMMVIKLLLWIGGLAVLVPVGLSELLLGFAARAEAAGADARGFEVGAAGR